MNITPARTCFLHRDVYRRFADGLTWLHEAWDALVLFVGLIGETGYGGKPTTVREAWEIASCWAPWGGIQ